MSRWLPIGKELFSTENRLNSNAVQIVDDGNEAFLVIRIKLNSEPTIADNQVPPSEWIENKKKYRETSPLGMLDMNAFITITKERDKDPRHAESEINILAYIKPKVPHTGGNEPLLEENEVSRTSPQAS